MSESSQTTQMLDAVAKVLLRCAFFGFVLLLFWFGVLQLAGDAVYNIHGSMFNLTPHELRVIHYCGMGLLKLCVGVFFLFPWAAIRLVLRKSSPQ